MGEPSLQPAGDQRTAHEQQLEARLREAEAVLEALRRQDIDAVVGSRGVAMLRLHDVEKQLRRSEEDLRRLNEDLEQRVSERTTELRHRTAQLEELALQLTEAESRERRQLAELLHDHLQQLLVGVRMRLCRLRRLAADPRLGPEIDAIENLTAEAIQSSRTLTYDLCPPVQQGDDLAACLLWLSQWMQERHGLAVVLEAMGAPGVPDPGDRRLRNFLFQSARELLFNVVKHAGVDHARVRVGLVAPGVIELAVEDDGVGLDPCACEGPCVGFGLATIRERVELLGGTLQLGGGNGAGTRVTIRCPAAQERGGDGV